jgi:hypothetical protein
MIEVNSLIWESITDGTIKTLLSQEKSGFRVLLESPISARTRLRQIHHIDPGLKIQSRGEISAF